MLTIFRINISHFAQFLPPANEVWGKIIFLHLSVILFTGGTWAGTPPRTRYPLGPGTPTRTRYTPGTRYTPSGQGTPLPKEQVHPHKQVHPPGPGTAPVTRYTPCRTRYTPQDQVHPLRSGTHPGTRYTPPDQVHPPKSACWEIRATSGRYASYWNAFLLLIISLLHYK